MKFENWIKTAFPNKGNNSHTVYSLNDMSSAFYAGKMHGTEKEEEQMDKKEAGTENIEKLNNSEIPDSPIKKTGKAKITSLIAQIIAAIWVAVWSGKRFFVGGGTTTDIILSGFAIAACFSPVYFNMILDKIKNIKFGSED